MILEYCLRRFCRKCPLSANASKFLLVILPYSKMRTDFVAEKMKRRRHRNQNVAQISYCFESFERNEKYGRNDAMNWHGS